jgi:MFS family permease
VQGGLIRHFQRILGLKKMLMIGAPMVAIGLTIMPLPSKENFYLVQVIAVLLLSLGNGMLMPSINSLVSINTPKDIQGQMLGSMQSIGSLARSIGPLFAGYLYLQHFTAPYWMGGLLMLAVWILALMLSRRLVDAAPKS